MELSLNRFDYIFIGLVFLLSTAIVTFNISGVRGDIRDLRDDLAVVVEHVMDIGTEPEFILNQ